MTSETTSETASAQTAEGTSRSEYRSEVKGVVATAVSHTPGWVLGFSGGVVTLSVCIIAILQLGGFSAPMQRIMNAKAAQIERAAESVNASAGRLEETVAAMQGLDSRVTDIEHRLDRVDQYHKFSSKQDRIAP